MADIYISYKREDLLLAKELADKLQQRGWSVWWDRDIPVGKVYDQVIDEELAKAKCIIVIWSPLSVNSLNVKEEAMEGLRRNILIPLAINEANPPYGFRMIQTMPWQQNANHNSEAINELAEYIQRLVPNKAVPQKEITTETEDKNIPEPVKPPPPQPPQEPKPPLAQTATLHFVRKYGFVGILVSVNILVDGKNCGKLVNDDEIFITVNAGMHVLKMTVFGSPFTAKETINIRSNETMVFDVGFALWGTVKLTRN